MLWHEFVFCFFFKCQVCCEQGTRMLCFLTKLAFALVWPSHDLNLLFFAFMLHCIHVLLFLCDVGQFAFDWENRSWYLCHLYCFFFLLLLLLFSFESESISSDMTFAFLIMVHNWQNRDRPDFDYLVFSKESVSWFLGIPSFGYIASNVK